MLLLIVLKLRPIIINIIKIQPGMDGEMLSAAILAYKDISVNFQ